MAKKDTVIIGQRFICEYVEQPDKSCSDCDLKGCKECEEAACIDEFTGKTYILKILEKTRC